MARGRWGLAAGHRAGFYGCGEMGKRFEWLAMGGTVARCWWIVALIPDTEPIRRGR